MKIIAILILLLPWPAFAAEVVLTDFSEKSIPILNEDLRQKDSDIRKLQNWYSSKEPTELSITAGAVTVTRSAHSIDTETAASTDDLATINGGSTGNILTLYAASSSRTVVLKDGTGNIQIAGDCTLDNTQDTAQLFYTGTYWQGIACSNNGA